jgi:hypothetical protein
MRQRHDISLTAPLVDIAQALARAGCPGGQHERYRLYEEWARDFRADFRADFGADFGADVGADFGARAAAGRKPARTYLSDVTAFALRRAAAHGFEARCEDGARLCSEARLVAGVR